ncbi:MAG TPA: hypothetical protein VG406_20645 [Isosphaeraceae bacterium]|jgi:hypothetical protein|nr:hypothetical protein [Isosphaeraceae bacterium]
MGGSRSRGVAALVAVGIAAGTAGWGLRAQGPSRRPEPATGNAQAKAKAVPKGSIAAIEAMLRPAALPFQEPTPLDEVAAHLRTILGVPVVLDRAALDRRELTPESTVTIEKLDGVRLRTALRLLLEPVGLVARVLPEDNIVLITDAAGSDDPIDHVLAELRRLHDDVHTLQDTVDDLYDEIAPPEEVKDLELQKVRDVRRAVDDLRRRDRARHRPPSPGATSTPSAGSLGRVVDLGPG